MKHVLITGKNSYIGGNFAEFVKRNKLDINVSEIDMVEDTWRTSDFSNYDTVFHVAGLAHSTPDESMREIYYKVNTNLAIETAKKAKEAGVKQFIFMSSIIVYGSGELGKSRCIDMSTPLTPDNFYGDSKVQAEKGLLELISEDFKVVIIRPPMIYGHGSKGNYPRLSRFAKSSLLFPNYSNQRSMLYIKNLCNFICLMIQNDESGIFLPQNEEYVCTSSLVKMISEINNHPMHLTKIFNPVLNRLQTVSVINKLFGNLVIDKNVSKYKQAYCIVDFETSIRETESAKE